MKTKLTNLKSILHRVRPRSQKAECRQQSIDTLEKQLTYARKKLRDRQRIRVFVNIAGSMDKILLNRLESLVKRELRKLGDVDIIEDSETLGSYELGVIANYSADGSAEFYAVSLNLGTRKISHASIDGEREYMNTFIHHDRSFLFQCKPAELETSFQCAVAGFDVESFDVERHFNATMAEFDRDEIQIVEDAIKRVKTGESK